MTNNTTKPAQNLSSEKKTDAISRKQFFKLCGTVIAGGSLLGVSGAILKNRQNAIQTDQNELASIMNQDYQSPYKLVSSFQIPEPAKALRIHNDYLLVASEKQVSVFNSQGKLLNQFQVNETVRDLFVDQSLIYILQPRHISVYNFSGELVNDWNACSEQSDYCSIAVSSDALFVTDAGNKNIAKYSKTGQFDKFIQSPNRFIIPSYTFGITCIDDIIYCSNSGRHLIESYTNAGDYIQSFGQPGGAAGLFCGCCNPVHLTHTITGDILTSEKGNPRISCYSRDGAFKGILLNAESLGGGNLAYQMAVEADKIVVAGKNMVSTFKYDPVLAKQTKTACAACSTNCPLKNGIVS